ncbi:flavodoxin domain-containing protein [Bifidobacterium gallicum]|uniref:Flavodoxin domain-containing protein n=1 Tax=Bifidobacterium gallicum DSM 20093 = LMG 11596 TaxID=561180 RepID=D1NS40_9BIFI|nr:flavodoxin domain-containing protein [Bifidobacterium gallicum]EFA23492.1 hypothetical protein BIFGAL_02594 [Bifidobacterium gallicum DSM 20093 = LMG 11596]KFI57226.1 hypothetical protein BGLCM_1470 [Bifidobacterium gallicum DSM 20093 = LMG 11596]
MGMILVYKSKSGFTQRYAQWVAWDMGCEIVPVRKVNMSTLEGCDVFVYGARIHAGRVDGLPKARELFAASKAKRFVIFATGATPCSQTRTVNGMWRNSLTPDELVHVPHFYMQAGICYEKLGLLDRMMLKLAASMLGRQEQRNPMEVGAGKDGIVRPSTFQAVWNYPDGDFVYFDGNISAVSYG